MSEHPNRTVHAQQAFELSDLFAYKFGPRAFSGRRLRLMEPDGPSTAGGKLARQSMVLVADDPEGTNVVVGWVDGSARQSEVRTFAAVAQQFSARHGRPLDMKREDYEALIKDVETFLRIQKIDVKRVDSVPLPPQRAPAPASSAAAPAESVAPQGAGSQGWLMLLAGLVLGFLFGFLVFGR
jgi:hypothetical protein